MSEVKRYHVTEAGLVEGEALGRINVVLGADHDRVTADAARLRAELECSRGDFAQLERISEALQQRLTAADERADVLEAEVKRLNRAKLSLKELAESRADNCSVYRQHLSEALLMAEKVRDASPGMQRKYLSDLIVHLYQSSDAALKPAERAHQPCESCKGSAFRADPETGIDEGCGACGASGYESPSDPQ